MCNSSCWILQREHNTLLCSDKGNYGDELGDPFTEEVIQGTRMSKGTLKSGWAAIKKLYCDRSKGEVNTLWYPRPVVLILPNTATF